MCVCMYVLYMTWFLNSQSAWLYSSKSRVNVECLHDGLDLKCTPPPPSSCIEGLTSNTVFLNFILLCTYAGEEEGTHTMWPGATTPHLPLLGLALHRSSDTSRHFLYLLSHFTWVSMHSCSFSLHLYQVRSFALTHTYHKSSIQAQKYQHPATLDCNRAKTVSPSLAGSS